ncbi:MAG: SAM-dependent DNA methyltransferase, partial [Candidatus Eremiobacterota bacterium]
EEGRFRRFHISEIKERGYKLDITWLKDNSIENADELPEPEELAGEAITELEAMADELRDILRLMDNNGNGSI